MRIVIYGAGSVGCYIGGRLLATGADVTFIARERLCAVLQTQGLHLSDYLGYCDYLAPECLFIATELPEIIEAITQADLVLVTVKSAATAAVAEVLSQYLPVGRLVLSFQNGLHNAEVLSQALPERFVLTGMVPFNVLQSAPGHFHQGSAGELMATKAEVLSPALVLFAAAGLPIVQHNDMTAVQWSKLLLNLNNAINALSGLPLQAELSQRGYRRVLAAAQAEALSFLQQRQQALIKLTALPPRLLPKLLSVPDWLFKRAAKRMLAMDPLARSSMWEDLEAGRQTEVNYINGEVVCLAEREGGYAPVNTLLVALVHAAEAGGRRDWSADELWSQVQSCQSIG